MSLRRVVPFTFRQFSSETTTSYKAPSGKTVTLRNQAFINNKFVSADSGKTFDVINPSTEEVIARVAEGDKSDADKAVKAARAAFEGSWKKVDGVQRGKLLYRLADLIEQNLEEFATIEAADNGKPFSMCRDVDIPFVVNHLRYYAGWADKITGQTFDPAGQFVYTRREPIGVAAQLIPWNFPLLMFAWKLGPAIAAGCTVIVKPAEQTPLTALRLGDLIREAGFPAGVVNVLPGYGETAGAALSNHMDVDKVAFTGSVEVGRLVMQAAAKSNLKKVTLELGGKSPLVVFDDASVDTAANIAHQAIFFNQGQVCTAGSRVFVQEKVYDKFVEKSAELAKKRADVTADPFLKDTVQGPQVSKEQHDRVMGYVEQGKKEGAKLVAGGARKGGKGFFVQPTIFADVKAGMKIHDEEIFGPVLSVIKFKDAEDAIFKANQTIFGLGAGVVTNDLKKALKLSHAIRAGTVWVNTYHQYSDFAPFGGYKQSGHGREKGFDGLNAYLETKTVFINTSD